MKRELGIARCGLACCLCGESEHCAGCDSGDCPDKDGCENRACSLERGIAHCFDCPQEDCKKGDAPKRASPMGLQPLPGAMGNRLCWTVWSETRNRAWSTTGRALWGITTALRM